MQVDTLNVAYRQISNISPTLPGNKIVDDSDVVCVAPASSFPYLHLASLD